MSEPSESVYEEQLLQKVQRFQTTLIRVLSEGLKQPKIPAWWTSFEESTLKNFVAQYKKKVDIDNNLCSVIECALYGLMIY